MAISVGAGESLRGCNDELSCDTGETMLALRVLATVIASAAAS